MVPVKKIVGLLLIAAFLCSTVVGCGGPTSKPASPPPPAADKGGKDKAP
jgi:hypothetical protein